MLQNTGISPPATMTESINLSLSGEFTFLTPQYRELLITFPTFYDPQGTTELSIDVWIKNNVAGMSQEGIYTYRDGSNSVELNASHTGGEGLFFNVGGSLNWGRIVTDIHTELIYVAMVYNGNSTGNANRLKVYINAVQQTIIFRSGAVVPASIPAIGTAPTIGNKLGGTTYWDGLIDNLAVRDNALTQADVDYWHNGGVGREISMVNGFAKLGKGLNKGLGRGLI